MMTTFAGLPELHTRAYETRVFLEGESLKVVGAVSDTKLAGITRRLAKLGRPADWWRSSMGQS